MNAPLTSQERKDNHSGHLSKYSDTECDCDED